MGRGRDGGPQRRVPGEMGRRDEAKGRPRSGPRCTGPIRHHQRGRGRTAGCSVRGRGNGYGGRAGESGRARTGRRLGGSRRRRSCGKRSRRRPNGRPSRRLSRRLSHGSGNRAGRGSGRGCRPGLRRGRRRRSGAPRRQEAHRVEVALLVGRDANSEVHVGLCRFRVIGRPDRADRAPLHDGRPLPDRGRGQVGQRDRVAVGGLDRDDETVPGHLPGEADRPAGSGADTRAARPGDVEPAVLPRRVRVRAEAERPQHGPVRRPCPRLGHAWQGARQHEYQHDTPQRSSHSSTPCFLFSQQ